MVEVSWVVMNGSGPVGVWMRANSTVRPSSAPSPAGRGWEACSVIGQRLKMALPICMAGSPMRSCQRSGAGDAVQVQCIPSRSASCAARCSPRPAHTS
jgi:hypothetical protein